MNFNYLPCTKLSISFCCCLAICYLSQWRNLKFLQFTVYNFVRFTRHGLVGNVILRDLFEKSALSTWTEHTMQIFSTPVLLWFSAFLFKFSSLLLFFFRAKMTTVTYWYICYIRSLTESFMLRFRKHTI